LGLGDFSLYSPLEIKIYLKNFTTSVVVYFADLHSSRPWV